MPTGSQRGGDNCQGFTDCWLKNGTSQGHSLAFTVSIVPDLQGGKDRRPILPTERLVHHAAGDISATEIATLDLSSTR